MRKIICCVMPMFFLAALLAVPGGEFWEKKEYQQWAQKECAKLLEDSPWAKELKLTAVSLQTSGASADGLQSYIRYHLQFRSAKPIRQAMVRQMQIAQKYESLSAEQKQEFDKKAESFLSADFSNAVVIYVTYETNDRENDRDLARYWQTQTTDLLKNSVYLIPAKTDKVRLAQYSVEQGGQRAFQFVFPRQVDGKPIVDATKDKSFKLEFNYPVIGGMGDGRAYLEFKVEKMVFAGDVAY